VSLRTHADETYHKVYGIFHYRRYCSMLIRCGITLHHPQQPKPHPTPKAINHHDCEAKTEVPIMHQCISSHQRIVSVILMMRTVSLFLSNGRVAITVIAMEANETHVVHLPIEVNQHRHHRHHHRHHHQRHHVV
jgi:hypothetical protein